MNLTQIFLDDPALFIFGPAIVGLLIYAVCAFLRG